MKIAEVSEQYSISADTLRYYERVGLIPSVNRNESGIRDYNDLDLRRVEFIFELSAEDMDAILALDTRR